MEKKFVPIEKIETPLDLIEQPKPLQYTIDGFFADIERLYGQEMLAYVQGMVGDQTKFRIDTRPNIHDPAHDRFSVTFSSTRAASETEPFRYTEFEGYNNVVTNTDYAYWGFKVLKLNVVGDYRDALDVDWTAREFGLPEHVQVSTLARRHYSDLQTDEQNAMLGNPPLEIEYLGKIFY